MKGPLAFNASKNTIPGDATVSGDLTFASGKGITSIGDIVLQDTKAIKTGVAANDLFYLDLYDADGAAYVHGLTAYGGINAPNFGFDVPVTFNSDVTMGTQIIDADSGEVTFIDMPAGASADGTVQSLIAALDGVAMFTLYGKSDGAGAVDERSLHCGTYLKLHITDTDSAVEGEIWYDASEDKLKFKTATGVETITSS